MDKMTPEELAASLDGFSGGTTVYKHSLGLVYTEGVKFLAENAKCYWLLDAIASYQPRCRKDMMLADFQLWRLEIHQDQSASLICLRDSNDEAFRQEIEFTDFPQIDMKLYVENNTILLPSER